MLKCRAIFNLYKPWVEQISLSGDNLMSMLLKPSYTTQDSEKVEEEEQGGNNHQSTITKMLNAASIKPPPPPV